MKYLGRSLIVVACGTALGGCVAAVIGNAPHSGTVTDSRARAPVNPDLALSVAVSERLGADGALRRAAISVSARGGTVTLRGGVGSEALRLSAERSARAVAGVSSVDNQLQVN